MTDKQNKFQQKLNKYVQKLDKSSQSYGAKEAKKITRLIEKGADLNQTLQTYLEKYLSPDLNDKLIEFAFKNFKLNAKDVRVGQIAVLKNNWYLFNLAEAQGLDFNDSDDPLFSPVMLCASENKKDMFEHIYKTQGISNVPLAYIMAVSSFNYSISDFLEKSEYIDLSYKSCKSLPLVYLCQRVAKDLEDDSVYTLALTSAKKFIDHGASPYDFDGKDIVSTTLPPLGKFYVYRLPKVNVVEINTFSDLELVDEEAKKKYIDIIYGKSLQFLFDIKEYYEKEFKVPLHYENHFLKPIPKPTKPVVEDQSEEEEPNQD